MKNLRQLRQIRYNVETNTDEQAVLRHNWTFFILNEPREIKRLEQRILKTLAPVDEFQELAREQIPNSNGLNYQAFQIKSNKGWLTFDEKRQIYKVDKTQFKHDRQLDSIGQQPDIWFENIYVPGVLRE